jgi:hypothetical protein
VHPFLREDLEKIGASFSIWNMTLKIEVKLFIVVCLILPPSLVHLLAGF